MTSSAALSLLLRSSPPLAIITRTDKSGLIVIVTALCLAFAFVSLLIRVYVRLQSRPNPVGWDDAFLIGAFAISIFQNACVFLEVHKGLGKTINEVDPSSLLDIQKAAYADHILYIVSVWLTKLSVVLLFLRLSPKRGHMVASKVNVVVVTVTALVSILIIALRCNLAQPWIFVDSQNLSCTGLFARWQTVAAFDVSLEIMIFTTSIYLFQALRLPFSKKFSIIIAFASRLLIIIPIGFRLHYLASALESSNYTLDATYAILCKQIEISYAIIAATLPCLRPFMTATVTYYGGAAEGHRSKLGIYSTNGKSSSSGKSQQRKKSEAIRLSNITSHIVGSRSAWSDYMRSQPSYGESQVQAGVGLRPKNIQRVSSSESRQIMIRTEVEQYTIEHRPSDTIDADNDHIGRVH